ncbi:DUF2917 domain-containing protein [Paraburkholderia acidisoli]|uniref:DUF2917 domain-containing protein n=1 Tax=Paraburkholderia acidisoli TaxID=2571748 RepID=UPI001E29250D|nr:DUF2917 domain-containing protein [Paraburkholderia acidisoli]
MTSESIGRPNLKEHGNARNPNLRTGTGRARRDLAARAAHELHVSEGELWLTIDGDAGDYWLRAGDAIDLAGGARVHVSAGSGAGMGVSFPDPRGKAGARFVLALGGARAAGAQARDGFAEVRAGGASGVVARLGETLRDWARRGQWGVRAAG